MSGLSVVIGIAAMYAIQTAGAWLKAREGRFQRDARIRSLLESARDGRRRIHV